MVLNRVEPGRYLDSVTLMRVSRRLGALPGVEAAAAMIGTPANRGLLAEAGLLAAEGERASPSDLVIAVRATDERAAAAALKAAEGLILEQNFPASASLPHARSLAGALEFLPQANLALISVPGEFAAAEARKALDSCFFELVFSRHVLLAFPARRS